MAMTEQDKFLVAACEAASKAGHPWPDYAACEAALESRYGQSLLARDGNNLFGTKQSATAPRYGTLDLPTKEYVEGEWETVMAHWVKYPSWAESFTDRMDVLRRLQARYPHYANALKATSGEAFVREVSATWSTDPNRADKVLEIYAAHRDLWAGGQTTTAGPDPQSTTSAT